MAAPKDSTIVAGLKNVQRRKLTRDEMIHVTAVIAMLDTGEDEAEESPEK